MRRLVAAYYDSLRSVANSSAPSTVVIEKAPLLSTITMGSTVAPGLAGTVASLPPPGSPIGSPARRVIHTHAPLTSTVKSQTETLIPAGLSHTGEAMYRRSTVSHTAHRDIVLGLMDENGPEVLFYSRGWDARGSQWHFLEDFVSDFYIRRYGLHSLAEQHMRTLVRSVALHQADLHIRMFSRLLEGSLSSNDQAFFLTVRSLCRYGVPRRAWTIAGLPIGGRAKMRAEHNLRLVQVAGRLRLALARYLKRKRRGVVLDPLRPSSSPRFPFTPTGTPAAAAARTATAGQSVPGIVGTPAGLASPESQGIDAVNARKRMLCTLTLNPVNGASGATRAKKDAEGCCWSLWTMERLGQLMMCTPEAVTSMDVRQCTPLNMVFPEGSQGRESWVSLRKARDIIRLVALAHDQDELLYLVQRHAVVGFEPEWRKHRLPDNVLQLLSTCPRIDRDVLGQILTESRFNARVRFIQDLEWDFWNVFDRQHCGLLRLPEVADALHTYFPGFFPPPLVEVLFHTVMELAEEQGIEGSGKLGWTLPIFLKFIPILSLRCC